MVIVRHTEECAGKPNAFGRLTGTCDCKTAKLDESARSRLTKFLGTLASESIKAGEESEYFALRLDGLAEQIARDARSVRVTAKRSDKTTKLTTSHKVSRMAKRLSDVRE